MVIKTLNIKKSITEKLYNIVNVGDVITEKS